MAVCVEDEGATGLIAKRAATCVASIAGVRSMSGEGEGAGRRDRTGPPRAPKLGIFLLLLLRFLLRK